MRAIRETTIRPTAPVQVDPVRGFDPLQVTDRANEATFGGGAGPHVAARQRLSVCPARLTTTNGSTSSYGRNVTPTPQSSILSMLHGRASLRPDDVAFTFTDYVHDPAGVSESLTWSQLSRRTLNVARELSLHASVGDRAVILAPQSLDYIAAFLGSMQAGLIAVPLPLPHRGSSHERVGAVFADTSPSVVLTTSAVADDIAEYVDQARLDAVPKIVEIDSMNLDGPDGRRRTRLSDS